MVIFLKCYSFVTPTVGIQYLENFSNKIFLKNVLEFTSDAPLLLFFMSSLFVTQ